MADKTIEAGILLSGEKEFKTAVTSINKSLTSMKSELSLVSAECEGQANTLESLSKKNEVLNKIWEEQKRKVSATKDGLNNARESYDNVGKGLEKLWVDLEKATDKMQDMERIYGTASDEAKKQQQAVDELAAAVEKGERNYIKAGDRVKDWETKLNYAEGQVIKANKALNQNTAYMREAENATDGCATSIDAFGKETKNTSKIVTDYGEKIKSALVNTAVSKGTEMLTTMGSAAASAAVEMEQAGNQIQASTGLTGEALEQYKDVLEDVYANNYGDSLDDVSQSIAKITHNMGELDDTTLQSVTESAITLRDTFDMDLDETLRGAKSLMYQFGITAEEAFDLLGSGAQSGLNYTDELGDNVSEYAGNFAQAGYSAEEYFQLLKNGTSNGAYNLDKVNDAINEVTNKLADGSVEKSLSIYSANTQNLFKQWQQGGATQKQVIDSIVADINNCTNQQDALTMSATAFGTMGEDSNLKFVQSLTSVGDTFEDVKGKMNEIKEIKYDDLNSQITEIGRTIQMKLGDQLQKLLPAVSSGLELVADNLDLVMSATVGLGTAIGLNKMFKSGFFQTAIKGLTSLVKVTSLAEIKTLALNAAAALGPWGIAAIAIGGVAAALVAFTLVAKDAESESTKLLNKTKMLSDEAKELNKSIEESDEAIAESKTSTEAQYGAYQIMSDKLYALNDSLKNETQTEEEANRKRSEMKYYINELNEAMPGLNLEIDKQNGLLIQGKEATDQYIESMKQRAMVAVMEEELNKLLKDQAEALLQVETANILKSQAEEQNAEALERATAASAAWNEMQQAQLELESGLIKSADEYQKKLDEIAKRHNVTRTEINKGEFALSNYNIEQNKFLDAADQADKTAKEQSETAENLAENINVTSKAIANLKDQYDLTDEQAEAITETFLGQGTTAENTGEKVKSAAELIQEKYTELEESIRSSVEGSLSALNEFSGGAEITAEELQSNLQSQIDGITNWKENLVKLSKATGQGMSEELLNELIEMGPQGANAVQAMVDALEAQDGSFEALAKTWTEALTLDDGVSKELSLVARQVETGVLGIESTVSNIDLNGPAAAFSELSASVENSVQPISDLTKQAFSDAVANANAAGVDVPKGIADGIRDGTVTVEDATAYINQLLGGSGDNAAESGRAAGTAYTQAEADAIADNASQVSKSAQSATEDAGKAADKYTSTFQSTGSNMMVSMARGMSEARGNVTSTTGGTVLSAISRAQEYSFSDTGYNLMSGLASGINAGSNLVYDAVRRVVKQAKDEANKQADSHSPSRVFRDQVGLYIAQGMALGMQDGKQGVIDQAVGLARAALYGAQEELDINSPSKVFKKAVGEQIAAGVAFGIEAKKGTAVNESKALAKDVYKAAVSWMNEYKKKNATTLEDEKHFWEQLSKTVNKGTQEYKKALSNADKIEAFEKKIQKKVDKAFDVSKTVTKNGKKVKKSTKEYTDDIYSAATKYLNNYKVLHDVSLQEEEYYWQRVKSKLKKGTQAWYEATKQLKSIKAEIKQTTQEAKKEAQSAAQEKKEYGLSGSGLDMYKTYYKVSAKAEVEYWDTVRKQFKAGTAERIEADQKYFDAKENLNEQLKDLEDDYYDKCKDVQDKLTDDIKDLTDTYNDAFEERKSSIKSAFGTFDEFYSEAESPEKLLANMQSQVAGYALWIEQLQELSAKGIVNDQFMQELEEMGPEAAATIMSLNMMTEEQLKQANAAWEERDRLAEAQAAKETEALRLETENKIKELTAAAQQEMNAYKAEYEKASAELTAAIEKPLKDLANKATTLGEAATAKLIQGIGNQAKSKDTANGLGKVTDQIAKGLNELPKAGKSIGKDMLNGILKGLSNSLAIKKGAKSIVNEIEDAIKKEAGIKSPSTRFRDIVGKQLSAGIAVGIEQGSGKAVNASADMIEKMLGESKKKVAEQQKTLTASLESINGGARIAAINDLVNTPVVPNTTVTVNNSEVAQIVSQIAGFMQEMRDEMRNLKVVLDTGTLVGEISPDVGNNLAAITRRLR